MEVLLLAVMAIWTASNILCFLIGARVGQKVDKGEEVQLPNVNPMELYREKQARKEADRVREKYDTIMRNVDNYNGTSEGQEDVPR